MVVVDAYRAPGRHAVVRAECVGLGEGEEEDEGMGLKICEFHRR